MCTPVDGRCEPRDWWFNLSIQASSELVVRHELLNLHRLYSVLASPPSARALPRPPLSRSRLHTPSHASSHASSRPPIHHTPFRRVPASHTNLGLHIAPRSSPRSSHTAPSSRCLGGSPTPTTSTAQHTRRRRGTSPYYRRAYGMSIRILPHGPSPPLPIPSTGELRLLRQAVLLTMAI